MELTAENGNQSHRVEKKIIKTTMHFGGNLDHIMLGLGLRLGGGTTTLCMGGLVLASICLYGSNNYVLAEVCALFNAIVVFFAYHFFNNYLVTEPFFKVIVK